MGVKQARPKRFVFGLQNYTSSCRYDSSCMKHCRTVMDNDFQHCILILVVIGLTIHLWNYIHKRFHGHMKDFNQITHNTQVIPLENLAIP